LYIFFRQLVCGWFYFAPTELSGVIGSFSYYDTAPMGLGLCVFIFYYYVAPMGLGLSAIISYYIAPLGLPLMPLFLL